MLLTPKRPTSPLALALALSALACGVGRGGATERGAPPSEKAPQGARAALPSGPPGEPPSGRRPLRDDEMSEALERKADEVLKGHAGGPVGAEVPFELGGRRYVARVEWHYRDEGGGPGPKGQHKGVTLYAAD